MGDDRSHSRLQQYLEFARNVVDAVVSRMALARPDGSHAASHDPGLRCLSEAEPTQIALDSLYSRRLSWLDHQRSVLTRTPSRFANCAVVSPLPRQRVIVSSHHDLVLRFLAMHGSHINLRPPRNHVPG